MNLRYGDNESHGDQENRAREVGSDRGKILI